MIIKNKDVLIGSRSGEYAIYRKKLLEFVEYSIRVSNPYHRVKKVYAENFIKMADSANRVFVVSIGKAGVSMAKGLMEALDRSIERGIIITPYGYRMETRGFEIIEAGHPIPDDNSVKGAERVMEILDGAREDDIVFLLVSGGGSACLSHPPVDVPFEEKRDLIKELIGLGASISELNTVRRHLSIVKGGWLAFLSSPAVLINLIVSDVPGDLAFDVASGPGVPDPTTFADAMNVLKKYGLIDKFSAASEYILSGVMGMVPETPDENHPVFHNVYTKIVLKNSDVLNLICERIYSEKNMCMIVPDGSMDEIIDILGNYVKRHESGFYVSGGEFYTTSKDGGRGGPSQEFLVRFVLENKGEDFVLTAFDTDGIDGNSYYAGGIVDRFSFSKWELKGLNPLEELVKHNTSILLEASEDAIKMGNTGTNINQIRILFIP